MTHAVNLTAHSDPVERALDVFAGLRRRVADRLRYVATFEALDALGDRQLADIGLTRDTLREIARAAVYAD